MSNEAATLSLETLMENHGRIEAPIPSQEQPKEPTMTDETPATETPSADAVPKVTDTPKEEDADVDAPKAEEKSNLDKFFEATENSGKKPEWDDKAREAFRATFGQEDPEAVLSEYNTLKETISQAEDKAKQAEKIIERTGKMPYEMAKAIDAYLNGKDYKPFLKELSTGVTMSKPAKELDKVALVDKYYSGKFTAEQKEAIKNGDADEDEIERFNDYHERAAEKHDTSREKEMAAHVAEQQAKQAREKAVKDSDLAAVAYVKNNPALSALLNELPPDTVDKFLSGELEDTRLYNPDGTSKKERLALLLKAELFDRTVARAMEGARVAGKAEAKSEQHGKLPQGPASPNGRQPIPPKKEGDGPKIHPDLQRVMMT